MIDEIANKVREGRNKPAHEVAEAILSRIAGKVEGMKNPCDNLAEMLRHNAIEHFRKEVLKLLKG